MTAKVLNSFKCWSEEVTHNDVVICWTCPSVISRQDILYFQLVLKEVGKTDSMHNIRKHKEKDEQKMIFNANIDDTREKEYTLSGLSPSTAYRVTVSAVFRPGEQLSCDYQFFLGLKPTSKSGDMPDV